MNRLAEGITKIIDFFYVPFRKIMPEQVFRYAACGGGNMVLDWVLYFLIYNFVIGHELVYLQSPISDYAVDGFLVTEIRDLHAIGSARCATAVTVRHNRGDQPRYQLFWTQALRRDLGLVSDAE